MLRQNYEFFFFGKKAPSSYIFYDEKMNKRQGNEGYIGSSFQFWLKLTVNSICHIHVHAFVVTSSHFFLCYEKSLNFFFLSFCYLMHWLVGHQALVKQNKGPVRGRQSWASAQHRPGGWRWRYGFVNEWRHTYMLWFVFPLFSQLILCWKMNWKKWNVSLYKFSL